MIGFGTLWTISDSNRVISIRINNFLNTISIYDWIQIALDNIRSKSDDFDPNRRFSKHRFRVCRRIRPPLAVPILGWSFLLALLGITVAQNLFSGSLYFISSTLQTAILNLIPAVTYLLSVISRQEKAEIKSLIGKGKILGTFLSVTGALVIVLWKGPSFYHHSANFGQSPSLHLLSTNRSDWVLGLVMVAVGVVSFSIWILLQGPVTKKYPAELSLTGIMFFMGVLQTGVVALCVIQEPSQWKLSKDLELLGILYGGVINGGTSYLIFKCSHLKGPVFVSMFTPLSIFFVVPLETIFLGEIPHFGSIIGAALIVGGLYLILWAKSKEEREYLLVDMDDGLASPLNSNQAAS
ncbi:hypothetical protein AMTRI_Chr06g201560 [Amborella trichopoda]